MARKRKQLFRIMIFNQSDNPHIQGMLKYFHDGNKDSVKKVARQLTNKLGEKSTLVAVQTCKVDRYKNIEIGEDAL